MTAPLSGYTSSLPTDVLLDSGVLYIGSTVWGAFSGGIKFDPGVTYRNVEFDGKRSPVKGLDRVTMRMPKISGTIIQLSPAAITTPTPVMSGGVAQIEPGAVTQAAGAWTGYTSYEPKDGGQLLAAGDYLTDVRAIWQRGGATNTTGSVVQVRFPVALVTKYDIAGQEGAEAAIAIEIEARLDPTLSGFTGMGSAPFRIEYGTTL
jgi:hypothetical protein